MKVIFLDVDGVLNYISCKTKYHGMLGIDDEKLELLKKIVDATGAKIVLTSTWKTDWFPTEYIEDLPFYGQYMVKQFGRHKLHIFAKTTDEEWALRGKGIIDFIKNSPTEIESFVILDDEPFDFESVGIVDKFVKTNFYDNGLTEDDVRKSIEILGKN
jgi:hypothetical protein